MSTTGSQIVLYDLVKGKETSSFLGKEIVDEMFWDDVKEVLCGLTWENSIVTLDVRSGSWKYVY